MSKGACWVGRALTLVLILLAGCQAFFSTTTATATAFSRSPSFTGNITTSASHTYDPTPASARPRAGAEVQIRAAQTKQSVRAIDVEGRQALEATTGVAAEDGGGLFASRMRAMRADPERGSIGGQWPTPTASNCRQCANEIQDIIGGQQAVISPAGSGRVLGPSANNPGGDWFEHVVVVKNGMVYDGFTGRTGMSINDFKAQFQYGDAINFGF